MRGALTVDTNIKVDIAIANLNVAASSLFLAFYNLAYYTRSKLNNLITLIPFKTSLALLTLRSLKFIILFCNVTTFPIIIAIIGKNIKYAIRPHKAIGSTLTPKYIMYIVKSIGI